MSSITADIPPKAPNPHPHILSTLLTPLPDDSHSNAQTPPSQESNMRAAITEFTHLMTEINQRVSDSSGDPESSKNALKLVTDNLQSLQHHVKSHYSLLTNMDNKVASILQILPQYQPEQIRDFLVYFSADEERAVEALLSQMDILSPEESDSLLLKAMLREEAQRQRSKGFSLCATTDSSSQELDQEIDELIREEFEYLKVLKESEEFQLEFELFQQQYNVHWDEDSVSNSAPTQTLPSVTSNVSSEDTTYDILEKERDSMEKWSLEKQLKKTQFLCEGEEKYLAQKQYHRYSLPFTHLFNMQAEYIHFRIVESQFYRHTAAGRQYRITNVEYIVNPKVRASFERAKKKLSEKHGFLLESMKPLILFHGTTDQSLEAILNDNFLLSKVGSRTDKGYYGYGSYQSESVDLPMQYGNGRNLICSLVVTGKAKKLHSVQTGCELTEGYDCHISTNGLEVVIFDMDCILPLYKITYTKS